MTFLSPSWRRFLLVAAFPFACFCMGCSTGSVPSDAPGPLSIVDQQPADQDLRQEAVVDNAEPATSESAAVDDDLVVSEASGEPANSPADSPEPKSVAIERSASSPDAAEAPNEQPDIVPEPLVAETESRRPTAEQPAEPRSFEPKRIQLPERNTVYAPLVKLSSGDAASCRVMVDDVMPDLELADTAGMPVALSSLWGESKLTMVVFWTHSLPLAREQVERLEYEIAAPFREHGVRVVAINVADPAEQAGELLPPGAGNVVSLHDPDGSGFAEVATGTLPRTYLVDANGQILWFDLEYSRSMRRQLLNALLYFLTR